MKKKIERRDNQTELKNLEANLKSEYYKRVYAYRRLKTKKNFDHAIEMLERVWNIQSIMGKAKDQELYDDLVRRI